MNLRRFCKDKQLYILFALFFLVFFVFLQFMSTSFFGVMKDKIDYRIELNTLYNKWLLTKHSVINYLTSDRKQALDRVVLTNVSSFDKSLSYLDSEDEMASDLEILISQWSVVKNRIYGIASSNNSYKNFETNLYWIYNATNSFDSNLQQCMSKVDNFYQQRLADLWRMFYIVAVLVFIFTIVVVFSVNKMLKSARSEKEYRVLVSELIKNRENWKHNMALEIHDTVIQNMSFSKMLCLDLINSPNDEHREEKQQALTNRIIHALEQIRDISYEIRPPELARELKQIIMLYVENWKEKFGKECEYHFAGLERIRVTDAFKLNLYRIIQELLTNIGKHSDATFVRLNIIVSYPYILVKLADNSSGYNVESAMSKSDGKSHSGLRGVTERVKISQGEIKIKSETKKGVTIIMEFPIEGNTEANGE